MRGAVVAASLSILALASASAFAPSLYWFLLLLGLAGMGAVLAFRFPVTTSVGWLLIVGCTLEMSLGDILGPAAYQPIIAAVKGAGLLLAAVCVLRFGWCLDPFNPAFAFMVMFITGLAHGLHPGLTGEDSVRSLVGSAAPYLFSFSRLSRRWARAIIGMTARIPLLTVAAGGVLDLAGIRPLFVQSGGARLAALGHPAFLAGFTLAAIYACLIELYRDGRGRHMALLAANFVILILTGARAPMLYGVAVTGLVLAFVRAPRFPLRRRMALLLAALTLVPLAAGLEGSLSSLRLFNVLAHEAGDLSGREELWPLFEHAAAASPWFGWGVGAGNVVVPQGSAIVRYMHTWAAHNEYLRMEVEGGRVGEALLIGLFVLWCASHTERLPRAERIIMRLVFVAFACHAFTDNVLISTSASVLFTFVSAVFARGELEAEAAVQTERG